MIIDDKLMKYVIFQRRTECEVRQKCTLLKYTSDYIEEIIEYLTENGYINDVSFAQKYIENVIRLKKSSIYEIKIGMMRKGIDENIIDDAIEKNYESLIEFEKESAIKIVSKKKNEEIIKIKKYLKNKGYSYTSINDAIDNTFKMNDN